MVRVVDFLRLHHEYQHSVSSDFVAVETFYRSLEALRLSNFLDVDLKLKMIIQSRIKRLSYTVSSPSKKSAEIKKEESVKGCII